MDRPYKRVRRSYNVDDLISNTNAVATHPQNIQTHTMYDTVRNQFEERIKLLVKKTSAVPTAALTHPPQPRGFLHDLSVTGTPVLQCYTKDFEESLMRPPRANEEPCYNNGNCECMLIAQDHPFNNQGFIGVRCPDSTLCLLCVRKEVTQSFFHALSTGSVASEVFQHHFNLVRAGEYNSESCLWPSDSNGLSDPVVFHSRSNYFYQNGHIKQYNNVNF